MFYDHGMLEMWAASSSGWTNLALKDAKEPDDSLTEKLEAHSSKGFLPLVVSVSLLLLSLTALAWGTVKLWQGAVLLEAHLLPLQQLEGQKPGNE